MYCKRHNAMKDRRKKKTKEKNQKRSNIDELEKLRKSEREGILYLKRNQELFNIDQFLEDSVGDPIATANLLDSIPLIARHIFCDHTGFQYAAIAKLRFLLSLDNPPIDQVIEHNIVPRLLSFLLDDQRGPRFQEVAATTLFGITCGTLKHAEHVMQQGAIPIFVQLLSSEYDTLKEQAIMSLGNIANQSTKFRDDILNSDALTSVLALIDMHSDPAMLHNLKILRSASSALVILCTNPTPPFDQVKSALPTLRRLIHLQPHGLIGDICADACLIISYISNGQEPQIQTVIDADVCSRLMILLGFPQYEPVKPVLRFVGYIFKGSVAQIQVLIENQVFPSLHRILTEYRGTTVLKGACSAIANMTRRSTHHIQIVVDENIIPALVNLIEDEFSDVEVKLEAAFALSNAANRGSHAQIRYLVEQGSIIAFLDVLPYQDRRTLINCLQGLNNILKVGEGDKRDGKNVYAQAIAGADGFSMIEIIKLHPDVGALAQRILARYKK